MEETTQVPGIGADGDAALSFRGPLRYEVETSTTQLEAGRKFTVFMKVTNPYDVPVTILKVETQMPVEFEDPLRRPPSIWSMLKSWAKSGAEDVLCAPDTQRVRAIGMTITPVPDALDKSGAERMSAVPPVIYNLATRHCRCLLCAPGIRSFLHHLCIT